MTPTGRSQRRAAGLNRRSLLHVGPVPHPVTCGPVQHVVADAITAAGEDPGTEVGAAVVVERNDVAVGIGGDVANHQLGIGHVPLSLASTPLALWGAEADGVSWE